MTNRTPCEGIEYFYSYDTYNGNWKLKWALISLYSLLCTFGALGNLLVIAAMIQCPWLRTLRNFFILNLASSDLMMCVFTAPFTLYQVSNAFWYLGDIPCKIISSAQAVNIFVSSLALAAIGLDRYLLIIFPVRFRSNNTVAIICFLMVWIISFIIASPYFVATSSIPPPHFPYNTTDFKRTARDCGYTPREMCLENKEMIVIDTGTYTLLCFLLQYLLPLCVLSALYFKICTKLQARANLLNHSSSQQVEESHRRQRRTIILLTSLVATFATCWLPFNLYNTLAYFKMIEFSILKGMIWCHLLGISSACLNPVLYGFLNENFKAAYCHMWQMVKNRVRGTEIHTQEIRRFPAGSRRSDRRKENTMECSRIPANVREPNSPLLSKPP